MSFSKSILAVALFTAVSAAQAFAVTSTFDDHGGQRSFDSASQGRHGDDDSRLPFSDDRFSQGAHGGFGGFGEHGGYDDHGHDTPHGGGMLPAVPEPETVVLMTAGLGAICWVGRRRRSDPV